MKLAIVFENYLKYIEIKTSKGNFEFNKAHLTLVQQWFYEMGFIDHRQLNIKHINAFLIYLKEVRKNTNNSINKNLGCLKRALMFNGFTVSGLEKIKITNIQMKRFNILSEKDLKIILSYYHKLDLTDNHNLTKYLVIMLLLYTGCRRNEICNIKINDLDFDNNAIILSKTKSGSPRIVFFKEQIKEDLQRYIALQERDYLFHNFKYNTKFTPDNLSAMIRYDKKVLNLKNYSAHMIRHTFATLMVENGCSITALQLLLGHSSSKTTDIYLHMSIKRVKKDFDHYFPKQL